MKNKPADRQFKTVLVEKDEPLNLRVFVELIVKKIERGELNEYEHRKRKVR